MRAVSSVFFAVKHLLLRDVSVLSSSKMFPEQKSLNLEFHANSRIWRITVLTFKSIELLDSFLEVLDTRSSL